MSGLLWKPDLFFSQAKARDPIPAAEMESGVAHPGETAEARLAIWNREFAAVCIRPEIKDHLGGLPFEVTARDTVNPEIVLKEAVGPDPLLKSYLNQDLRPFFVVAHFIHRTQINLSASDETSMRKRALLFNLASFMVTNPASLFFVKPWYEDKFKCVDRADVVHDAAAMNISEAADLLSWMHANLKLPSPLEESPHVLLTAVCDAQHGRAVIAEAKKAEEPRAASPFADAVARAPSTDLSSTGDEDAPPVAPADVVPVMPAGL